MGRYDDAMYRYLSDNDRFADLFNAVFFSGKKVLRGEQLEPDGERYADSVCREETEKAEKSRKLPEYEKGFRDIKKRLRTGESFVVTAVENQEAIDYAMPWRIMSSV